MRKINLIYLLGTAYSGSTIFGYIIGSSDKVFNAGEIAYLNQLRKGRDEVCTCGKYSKKCNI